MIAGILVSVIILLIFTCITLSYMNRDLASRYVRAKEMLKEPVPCLLRGTYEKITTAKGTTQVVVPGEGEHKVIYEFSYMVFDEKRDNEKETDKK